jgi:thymidylate kinase
MINGVLLEGVDYAGKTSIADNLAQTLRGRGVQVIQNQCYLKRGPLIHFLEAQAKQLNTALERDWYYTTALLVDLYLYEQNHEVLGAFIVQDRHWLTTVGRNTFFNRDIEFMRQGLLERRHLPFRFNVYVRTTIEAKIRRCQNRPPKSPRDRYLAENPELHQQYDDFLLKLVPQDEDWLILDTSQISIEEATNAVLDYIDMGQGPSNWF